MKYTIKSVKPWKVEPRNGKYAYTVQFEEDVPDEFSPGLIDYFSDKEPKEGDKVEGKIGLSEKGRVTFYPPYKLDRHQANIVAQFSVKLAQEAVPSLHDSYGEEFTTENLQKYKSVISGMAEIYFDIAMELAEKKSE